MRVVFLHPAIRTYRVELFERLSRRGVEFLFTSFNAENTQAGHETTSILAKTTIRFHQCREIELGGKKNFSLGLWRVFKYDVVIFSCATSIPFVLLSLPLRLLGRRVVLFDELWKYPENHRLYDGLRPVIRFLVRKTVKAFVPAGSCAARYIATEYGIGKADVHIAYNTTVAANAGPESLRKSQRFQRLQFLNRKDNPVILYLGRLVKYKGLDVLIKAVAELECKANLLVVGDGPFRPECENLVSRLGIDDRVMFWGPCMVDESACFYELADVFVLPTRFLSGDAVGYESWGFTINEAMGRAVPVVATDAVGAAHDLIRHGETGWMCPADNVAALAEVLGEIVSAPDRTKRIGAQGKQWLVSRCSYQQNEEAFCRAIGFDE